MLHKASDPDFDKWSMLFNWVAKAQVLSAFEKLLYTRLHGHLGDNADAFPAIRTLAEELGEHVSRIQRGLKRLEELKLIAVERRTNPQNGSKTNSHYTFPKHPLMQNSYWNTTTCKKIGTGVFTQKVQGVHSVGTGVFTQKVQGVHSVGTKENHGRDSGEENHEREPKQPAEADASADRPTIFTSKRESDFTFKETNIFTSKRDLVFTEKEELDEEGEAALAEFAKEQQAELVAFDAKLRAEFNAKCPPLPITLPPDLESMPSIWMSAQDFLAKTVPTPGPAGELMMQQVSERKLKLEELATKASEKALHERKKSAARRQKRLDKRQQDYDDNPNAKGIEPQYQIPVKRFLALWYSEFEKKFPNVVQAQYIPGAKGFGKERGQAQELFRRFDTEAVLRGAKYLIQNWDAIKPRFFKGSATHPTIGMLKTFDTQIIPEAKEMTTAFEAKAAYDKWCSENSNPFKMPVDIRDGYEKAKKTLAAIGVK
jgi:hypothetical protein